MVESAVFLPPRRTGLILNITAAIVLSGASFVSFVFAFGQDVGILFGVLLMLGVVLLVPVPLAGYRSYALISASYRLERDGLRLRWGLRAEDIPLAEVEWVRRTTDLAYDLPLPPLSIPGAILGIRSTEELGPMEFMASDDQRLVLIATRQKVFIISPADPDGFIRSFQSGLELGSLVPFAPFSTRPAAYLAKVWSDRVMRWLVLVGLGLNSALFFMVAVIVPNIPSLPMGFLPSGLPADPGPSSQLMLLPVLGGLTFTADLIAGLFFYRRRDQRPVAYLFWSAGIFTPLLLMTGVILLSTVVR